MGRIEVVQGDITKQQVDAIVNAANSSLRGGGGVDGAIHRAAGPELMAAGMAQAPCPTGEARITPGFRLPANYVIHTVGPVWHGGAHGEADLLARCYTASLDLAAEHGVRTIAFPSISTGVYGYPLDQAAPVAIAAIRNGLDRHPEIALARMVCFSPDSLVAYQKALGKAP